MEPRSVLVTGAGSGLGRGIALDLAGRGHCLFLLDRDEASLQETVGLLGDGGACLGADVVDVSSGAQVEAFFAGLHGQAVDVLVNNAGLQHVSPITDFPEEQWDVLMDVMLKGSFLLSKAALPQMRANGYGRIVNIGSIHSLVASPFKGAYVAAKHGLHGLTKVIALETGDVDVTANTICPAYVRTPLVDSQIAAQAKANDMTEADVIAKIMLEPQPKKAFITVEEVAAMIAFLMSREARNVTGQSIAIDGGWTAR